MRGIEEWDDSDLLALIQNEVQESLTIDYKESAALNKDNQVRNKLIRNVSALANSTGGLIIYGIVENGHTPTAIDVGVDRNVITKEWLEAILDTNISPVIDGLRIRQIDLPSRGPDRVAYAIAVPQATSRAPHQANDHRYYKRLNFESEPMEDYEVRDLMRRSIDYGRKFGAAWELNLEAKRLLAAATERQTSGQDYTPRSRLSISVSNSLRSSGHALILLSKTLRQDVASLVNAVDAFNAIIETVDPGKREEARLNEGSRTKLAEMVQLARRVSTELDAILEREP